MPMKAPIPNIITDFETGKSNKHSKHSADGGSFSSFSGDLKSDHTYVMYKSPDVLIVPKTKLTKVITQPQIAIKGRLLYIDVSISLKEDIPVNPEDTPGFLLPIGGKVWEDKPYGDKLSSYNFILNKGTQDKDALKEGVTVRVNRLIIRNSDKAIIEKQAARVFKKGEYMTPLGRDEIKTDAKGEWGKYYLRDLGFTRAEIAKGYKVSTHIVKFEVEFEYDGIEFIPVPPLASLDYKASNFNIKTEVQAVNDSMAAENVARRDQFNRYIGEINGSTPMTADRQTLGKSIGVNGVAGADMNIKYSGTHNAQINRTVSKLDTKLNTRASTLNSGILYPLGDVYSIDVKQAMSTHDATSPTNGSFDLVIVMDNTKAEAFKNKEGVTVTAALDNKSVVVFHEANTHMENINLGLLKRKPVDLELESDLMLSIQFVNKKALINTFAQKYDLGKVSGDEFDHLISKHTKTQDDLQYKLDVYKADFIYRTAMYKDPDLEAALQSEATRLAKDNNDISGRELDVYLQYKQAITNYSQVDHAILTGLDMYFDKSLTPVLTPITKEIDKEEVENNKVTGQTAIAGDNIVIGAPEYRVVTLDTMFTRKFETVKAEPEYKDIRLQGPYAWTAANSGSPDVKKLTSLNTEYNANDILIPSARRLEVVTNFKISNDVLYQAEGITASKAIRLGNKHNLTEIAGYATYNKYSGKVTGKVDLDSAPSNVNLDLVKFNSVGLAGNEKQNFAYLEDDTATAPIISIELEEETPRKVSGRIWEEKRNRQVARVNMGDGLFNGGDGEKGIPNKVVTLEERLSIKAIDLSTQYKRNMGYDNSVLKDAEHYVDIPYIWGDQVNGAGISINSIRNSTKFQSYVRTNNNGNYQFNGVPAGNFVAKLPYITVGNLTTHQLGILDRDKVETTKIVDADLRSRSPQVYNGQDFKVSIYDAGNDVNLNQTWMPTLPATTRSYGRDSELKRFELYTESKTINGKVGNALEVLNIDYGNIDEDTKKLIEKTANMTAETPLMNLGLDFYGNTDKAIALYGKFDGVFALPGITVSSDGTKTVTPSKTTRGYSNVNIALEERPKTKLVLDKQVTRLTLKNSDGTKIVDAKYNTTYDTESIVMPAADKNILAQENADKKYDLNRKTTNGYTTEEYVLKVKTEVDKDSLNGDKVTPLNTSIYATKKPYWEDTLSASGLYSNARGWENIEPKATASRASNGYIHLNFDKQLLSDTNIEIEYEVQLYNLGEVDRATIQDAFKDQTLKAAAQDDRVSKFVGKLAKPGEKYSKLNHELDKDKYGFGRFFGRGYYTGRFAETSKLGVHPVYSEKVAKTYANKIIDYIDNSAVKDDLQNDSWAQIKNPDELTDLVGAYDNTGKKTFTLQADNMVDPNGQSYFTTGGSNIYMNSSMNKGLIPYYEYATAVARGVNKASLDPFGQSTTIAIKRLSSQQADEDLSFDNLVEIVEYSTDTGRRTPSSTPGNVNTRLSETFDGQNLEPDTGLALLVTITPPTGLSKAQRTTFSTLNIMLVAMVGIAVVTIIAKVVIDSKGKNKILPNEVEDINSKQ